MKYLKIQKNEEYIEGSFSSNIQKMISYLGLFPTFEQLSQKILTEIEKTAAENRITTNQQEVEITDEQEAGQESDAKKEDETKPKQNNQEETDSGHLISTKEVNVFHL